VNNDARPTPGPGKSNPPVRLEPRQPVPVCPADGAEAPCKRLSGRDLYAIAFGIFLGLSLIKFGNPVILDQAIARPATLQEAWFQPWPGGWSYWFLVPLALVGLGLGVAGKAQRGASRPLWPSLGTMSRMAPWGAPLRRRPAQGDGEATERFPPRKGVSCPVTLWLWMLPVIWFGWQLVSARQTVDGHLTAITLGQFGACLVCYFSGAMLFGTRRSLHWLLVGLLAAFAFCLVRAVNQRLFEFPQERQLLLEGERAGWTNLAPDFVARLKRDKVIVTTNGMDVANPYIMAKYAKGRVHGTLVYPNALAGAALLLWPVSIAISFSKTRHFRKLTRTVIIALTLSLGGAGFFWTGSKLAWLIAVGLLCLWLLCLKLPRRWKTAGLAGIIVVGAVVFLVRFHNYFAAGARSAGARLDCWSAAVQVVRQLPWTGSGPGTFQRPYAELKTPEAEMARLAHNDFLEQYSDSGIVGGTSYLVWIGLALAVGWRRVWRSDDPVPLTVFLGLLGWFVQGLGEFGLYIPGLAWPAFTLLGWTAHAHPDTAGGIAAGVAPAVEGGILPSGTAPNPGSASSEHQCEIPPGDTPGST